MRIRFFLSVFCTVLVAGEAPAQSLEHSLDEARAINQQAVKSQQTINKVADSTRQMLEEYRQLALDSDYFQVQKQHLTQALQQQEARRSVLLHQLETRQITEQRLLPLLASMVQALEQFIVLALPFHHQQRIDSVLMLRERVQDVSLSLADRFQLVMEAFQIELEYGNTLEAYRDQIQWQGQSLSVACLRVGRTALYFLTPDAATVGYWDAASRQWAPLPDRFARVIGDGIRVARGQVAPRLLPLPMAAVELSGQRGEAGDGQ